VAATYDGQAYPASGRAVIYLNGVAADSHFGNDGGSGTGLTGNVKPGQIATMGREGPAGGSFFTGFVDDVAIWKRALAPVEIERLFAEGQNGQSLGDLLKQPTSLIQLISARKTFAPETLEIHFRNLGPWQSFHLMRAPSPDGPFLVVQGLNPAELGDGLYRFDYPLDTNTVEFFRVEGQ
jgi:hypothetical protein